MRIFLSIAFILATSILHAQDLRSKLVPIGFNDLGSELAVMTTNDQILISCLSRCLNGVPCMSLLECKTDDLDDIELFTYDSISGNTFQGLHYVSNHELYIYSFTADDDSTVAALQMRRSQTSWEIVDHFRVGLKGKNLTARSFVPMKSGKFFTTHFFVDTTADDHYFAMFNGFDTTLAWSEIPERAPDRNFTAYNIAKPGPEGSVILAGINRINGLPSLAPFVVKYDSLGQRLWRQEYDIDDDGLRSQLGLAVKEDGSMYLAGTTNIEIDRLPREYPTVYYLDELGNEIWRCYLAEDWDDARITILSLSILDNGDILAVGKGSLYEYPDGRLNIDVAMMWRISPEGETIWYREYFHDLVYDDLHYGIGWLNNAVELPNGNIAATGIMGDTTILDDGTVVRDLDVWVIQVDSNGCYEPDCVGKDQLYTSTIDLPELGKVAYQFYPNPYSETLQLYLEQECSDCTLLLSDMQGRPIIRYQGLQAGQQSFTPPDMSATGYHIATILYHGQVLASELLLRE